MDIKWNVKKSDVQKIQKFVSEYKNNDFVIERTQRNIRKRARIPSRRDIWKVIVGCLLSTQQRSGPDSRVSQFMKKNPFPLDYARLKHKNDMESYCHKTLTNGGLRRANTISAQLSENLGKLESGLWTDLTERLKKVIKKTNPGIEKAAAEFMAANMAGFGPKQSRNFLQWLGLTRYEIPIDSRITKWFNNFGFPIKLSATALADPYYYQFVSDGIQALCSKCRLYPCILDAAIFTSFDDN